MKILVSGATGSLGSQFISRMLGKYQLGAITRNPDSLKFDDLTIHNLDLTSGDLSNLFSDYDVFIHCAAFASGYGKKAQFNANVKMVERMLPYLESSGIFTVFISSASVFDDMPRNVLQKHPSIRPRSGYSKSKYDVEKLILSSTYGNWIGLRPRAVIGKGDKTLVPRIENLIKKRFVIIPGGGKSLLDYTTMSDFLDSVEASISAGPKTRFYNISSGNPMMFKEMLMQYSSRIHGIERAIDFPVFPLRIISSIFPNQRINHYSLDQITKPMILDISDSKEELNWNPKQSFEECLEELL